MHDAVGKLSIGQELRGGVAGNTFAGRRDPDNFAVHSAPVLPVVGEIRHGAELQLALPQGFLGPYPRGHVLKGGHIAICGKDAGNDAGADLPVIAHNTVHVRWDARMRAHGLVKAALPLMPHLVAVAGIGVGQEHPVVEGFDVLNPIAENFRETWFSLGQFDKDITALYNIKNKRNGLYAFCIRGSFSVEGHLLNERDGLGIWDTDSVSIKSELDNSDILLMDIPML